MAIQYQIPDIGNSLDEPKKNYKIFILVTVIVVVGIGTLMLVSYYLNNRCYNSYRVDQTVERNDSNNVSYNYFNGNILKYSRSGVSVMDNTGKIFQNEGFEMKQPTVDACGNYILVADIMGKQFCVFESGEETKTIETSLPIVQAKVSEQGMAAVLLQDSDSNVLNVYNPYSGASELFVEIPTNVSEEGYPLDFDISPDGRSVAIAYMSRSGNGIENKVNFYNFTEVGLDRNTLVGGKSFEDSMVGQIAFVGSDEVAVFHEEGVTLFGNMKQPEIISEIFFDETIQSMAYSGEYIAAVTGEPEAEQKTLHLYNLKGKEQMSQKITYEYTEMKIYKEEIFFLSNHSCHILRTNGREKFSCEFENTIDTIFPTTNGSIYTLIDADTIQKITLAMV